MHNIQSFSAATTTLSARAAECVEIYFKEYVRGNTYYAYKFGNMQAESVMHIIIRRRISLILS